MMAIVVNGATCSLGEAVVDKLLSMDIDVVAKEESHKVRNETLLKFSQAKLLSEGDGFSVSFDALSPSSPPILITQSEFMRRMKEMSMTGGGPMMGMGNMPDSYNLIVNSNHKLINKITSLKGKQKTSLIKQIIDLGLLANNLLKGQELTNYINNSFKNL